MSDETKAVSRVGETLIIRLFGRDELANCVADDGAEVAWETVDGSQRGPMTARNWDRNRARQTPSATAEGGGS